MNFELIILNWSEATVNVLNFNLFESRHNTLPNVKIPLLDFHIY